MPRTFSRTDFAPAFLTYWKQVAPYLQEPEPLVKVLKYEIDWAFVEQKVAVEIDGGQYAPLGGRHARDADREKHNALTATGWRVFHFSPQMLTVKPFECIQLVAWAVYGEHILEN